MDCGQSISFLSGKWRQAAIFFFLSAAWSIPINIRPAYGKCQLVTLCLEDDSWFDYTPEDMATCIATWRLLDRVSCKALQGSHDINARLKMRCVMRASFVPFYCCINRAAREHTAPVAALLFSVCAFCLDNEKKHLTGSSWSRSMRISAHPSSFSKIGESVKSNVPTLTR